MRPYLLLLCCLLCLDGMEHMPCYPVLSTVCSRSFWRVLYMSTVGNSGLPTTSTPAPGFVSISLSQIHMVSVCTLVLTSFTCFTQHRRSHRHLGVFNPPTSPLLLLLTNHAASTQPPTISPTYIFHSQTYCTKQYHLAFVANWLSFTYIYVIAFASTVNNLCSSR